MFHPIINLNPMKTKLFVRTISSILTIAINLIIGCKPTDSVPSTNTINCDSNNTVLIPEDMKARFYFKEGTYWIYKNIATGETDSMWVWKSSNEINPTNPKISQKGLDKCYEWFSYQIRNKIYFNTNYYTNIGISLYPRDGLDNSKELFGLGEISPVTNFRPQFRIEIIGSIYENQSGFEINFVDSISLSTNLFFKNVLNLNFPNGNSNDMYNQIYYAKKIGLVKFERGTDNSVWELIRYKINQ
jgi:hypothetical protein